MSIPTTWEEAAADARGCEGASLKVNGKSGAVTLDDVVIDDGLKAAFIMPTAVHGYIRFNGDGSVTKQVVRYEDRAPDPDERPPEGFCPLTECLCVGMSEGHVGELETFQSPNWGGRSAFTRLARAYARVEKRGLLPVCKIDSREKGDENGNYMPVFTVVDWVSRDRFPDLVEPMANALPAPPAPETARLAQAAKPILTATAAPAANDEGLGDDYGGPRGGPIDDSIPF